MSKCPFLLFLSRDDEGRACLKVQGDGIPLIERALSVRDCLRYSKLFAETALEIMDQEQGAAAEPPSADPWWMR